MIYPSVLGGGVEVSNMAPVYSSAMLLQKPVYVMQEAAKPAPQQVWMHAVPASSSQMLRPTANTAIQAAQPYSVPTIHSSAPQSLSAQPQPQLMTHMTQAPGGLRLVPVPGGGVHLQQAQPQQQQVVMALQQQPQQLQPHQPGSEVVYVNINGVLQQGVVQNGAVYLLNDSATAIPGSARLQLQAASGGQAPLGVAVAQRQPGMSAGPVALPNGTQVMQLPMCQVQQQQQQMQGAGQRQVYVQQVLPAGARLVPVSQPLMRPAQLPQQQMQQQQQPQQAQRPMMLVMQPSAGLGSAPMGVGVVTAPQLAGMQQASSARPQQMQMQVPMPAQQLTGRSSATVPAAAAASGPAGMQLQQALQPMQFSSVTATQQQMLAAAPAPSHMSMAVAAAAPHSQQASAQAFRPAVAAGTRAHMPGAPTNASTAAVGNKAPMPACAAGAPHAQLAVPIINSGTGFGLAAPQPVMVANAGIVPGSGVLQQQQQQLLVPGVNGDMCSPPVPPITPGVVVATPAPAAPGDASGTVTTIAGSSLLTLLKGSNGSSHLNSLPGNAAENAVVRMLAGSQSPSHGVIGSQYIAKDAMGASRSSTPAPAGSSPPRSQPGTPARSNGGGGLVAAGAAHASNKGAVMRLVARSFIETGIALEQAQAMVQPADRELLCAAFGAEAAEAAGAMLPSSRPGCAAASDAAAATPSNSSMLGGLGPNVSGELQPALSATDASVHVPGSSSNGGGGVSSGSKGLPGLLSLSAVEDVAYANDNNSSNMGSWGFSLFTGSNTIT